MTNCIEKTRRRKAWKRIRTATWTCFWKVTFCNSLKIANSCFLGNKPFTLDLDDKPLQKCSTLAAILTTRIVQIVVFLLLRGLEPNSCHLEWGTVGPFPPHRSPLMISISDIHNCFWITLLKANSNSRVVGLGSHMWMQTLSTHTQKKKKKECKRFPRVLRVENRYPKNKRGHFSG